MFGRVISTPLYRITVLGNLANSQERTCECEKLPFLLKADASLVFSKEFSKKFKEVTFKNSIGGLIYSIIDLFYHISFL